MPMLIVARGLQGLLGGGGILPIVQTVISDIVTPRERGQYQAYFSGVWTAAGIGGPIVGGVFAEHLHWSMIFWINVPLGVAALALLLPRMGKIPTFHRKRKVDWLGGVLLMASAVVFTLVLTWGGNRFSWASPAITAMIGAALMLALAFVWHARRGGSAVPAAAADERQRGALRDGRRRLRARRHAGPDRAHAAVLRGGLSFKRQQIRPGADSPGGRLHRRRGDRRQGDGADEALQARRDRRHRVRGHCSPPCWRRQRRCRYGCCWSLLSLFAFGLGTTFPISVVSIQNSVARAQVGTVTGALNFFRALAASFTVAAFTAILLMALGGGVSLVGEGHGVVSGIAAADMVTAFRWVFAAAAAMMAGATLLMLLMEEKPLAGPASVPAEMAE